MLEETLNHVNFCCSSSSGNRILVLIVLVVLIDSGRLFPSPVLVLSSLSTLCSSVFGNIVSLRRCGLDCSRDVGDTAGVSLGGGVGAIDGNDPSDCVLMFADSPSVYMALGCSSGVAGNER